MGLLDTETCSYETIIIKSVSDNCSLAFHADASEALLKSEGDCLQAESRSRLKSSDEMRSRNSKEGSSMHSEF